MSRQQEAESVTRRFFASWKSRDLEQVMAFIAPDCVLVNGALGTHRGADAIRTLFAPYFESCTRLEFRLLGTAAAADGDRVHNERLDVLEFGDKCLEIPVAGVVELAGGQIVAMRDYFDSAAVDAQRAGWDKKVKD